MQGVMDLDSEMLPGRGNKGPLTLACSAAIHGSRAESYVGTTAGEERESETLRLLQCIQKAFCFQLQFFPQPEQGALLRNNVIHANVPKLLGQTKKTQQLNATNSLL